MTKLEVVTTIYALRAELGVETIKQRDLRAMARADLDVMLANLQAAKADRAEPVLVRAADWPEVDAEEAAAVAAEEAAPEAAPAEQAEPAPSAPPSEPQGQDFAAAFAAAGGHEPRGLCKALRAVAVDWQGSRKQFLEAAVALGLNKGNASAEWQSGRRGKK